MDLPLVLAGLLPAAGLVVALLIAFRRRRTRTVPVFVNRYTLAVEDGPHAVGETSEVQIVTTSAPQVPGTRARPIG